MCTKKSIWRASAACTFIVLALVGLGIGIGQVAGSNCFVGYSRYAPTCAEADDLGNFQFTVGTSYYSQGKGPWVLTLLPRNSISDGLVDGSPASFPSSVLIMSRTDPTAGEIVSLCTGTLEDIDTDGGYQINAVDSIEFACSGGHDVLVKAPGDGCQ